MESQAYLIAVCCLAAACCLAVCCTQEPVTWAEVYNDLAGSGVKAIQPSEACAKASKGG